MQLLAPGQQEVVRRWAFGEWTVAQEHAATAIGDDVLGGLHVELDVAGRVEAPHVALVCAEGEWHVTPLRMAAVQLLARGWRVTVLGASTPPDHLKRTLKATDPDVLGVTTTLTVNLAGARRTVAAAHDVGVPVVAAGAALDAEGHRAGAIGADGGGPRLDPPSRRGCPRPRRPPVLHELLGWLVGLLMVRGVPRDLLIRGLEALRGQLADDLVAARELLLVGQRWVETGEPAPSVGDAASRNGDAAF